MTEQRLPQGWQDLALSDAGDWRGGGTPSKSVAAYWSNGAIPWVSPKDMKQPRLSDSEDHITEEAVRASATSIVPPGSILMVTRSGILSHTFPIAIADAPVALNQDLKALTPSQALLPDFVAASLKSAEETILSTCSKSGTTVASIEFDRLKGFRIPVPPLNEQRRIVAKLDALQARADAAKAALDAVPPLLERFRQSVLATAFRGDLTRAWREAHPDVEPATELLARIRAERRRRWETANPRKKYVEPEPVDTSNLPDLPARWTWARWEQVGLCQNGRAFPSDHYLTEGGTRLLRPGNLHVSGDVSWTQSNTRFMPNEWAERFPSYVVRGGELVMNLTAQSLKDEFLGRVCLTGPRDECLLNQRIARVSPIDMSPDFCLWLFKSPLFRSYVDSGLNSGSLIQHMFTSQVDDFIFPLPPPQEQSAILKSVRRLMNIRSRLSDVLSNGEENLSTLHQSILAKAFRGELVPQDPDDEPASVLLERIAQAKAQQAPAKPKRGRPATKPR